MPQVGNHNWYMCNLLDDLPPGRTRHAVTQSARWTDESAPGTWSPLHYVHMGVVDPVGTGSIYYGYREECCDCQCAVCTDHRRWGCRCCVKQWQWLSPEPAYLVLLSVQREKEKYSVRYKFTYLLSFKLHDICHTACIQKPESTQKPCSLIYGSTTTTKLHYCTETYSFTSSTLDWFGPHTSTWELTAFQHLTKSHSNTHQWNNNNTHTTYTYYVEQLWQDSVAEHHYTWDILHLEFKKQQH